jgi:hypothetical protein
MPYAHGRTYYDADSHLMELSEWLHLRKSPRDPYAWVEALVSAEFRRENPRGRDADRHQKKVSPGTSQ